MAQKLYEESNIQAIANAIRAKNGTSKKYKTSEMAAAIQAISGSGNVDGVPNPIKITGYCECRFAYNTWNWVVENFGDRISTYDITNAKNMFYLSYDLTQIPFDINFKQDDSVNISGFFDGASSLTAVPKFNNCAPYTDSGMFNGCNYLREIPSDFVEGFDFTRLTGARNHIFTNCYSLRSFPMSYLSHASSSATYNNSYYYYGFTNCYFLDELVGLPIPYTAATWTSNAFVKTFDNCSRLQNITFETNEDGTPIVVKWKNQIIDLTVYCGYFNMNYEPYLPDYYNSGCTDEDRVITRIPEPTSPNWWTGNYGASRYNAISATATIKSLPDASAYLAIAGGTNTIKLLNTVGLPDHVSEETIAIAASKGWTVSIV